MAVASATDFARPTFLQNQDTAPPNITKLHENDHFVTFLTDAGLK